MLDILCRLGGIVVGGYLIIVGIQFIAFFITLVYIAIKQIINK